MILTRRAFAKAAVALFAAPAIVRATSLDFLSNDPEKVKRIIAATQEPTYVAPMGMDDWVIYGPRTETHIIGNGLIVPGANLGMPMMRLPGQTVTQFEQEQWVRWIKGQSHGPYNDKRMSRIMLNSRFGKFPDVR